MKKIMAIATLLAILTSGALAEKKEKEYLDCLNWIRTEVKNSEESKIVQTSSFDTVSGNSGAEDVYILSDRYGNEIMVAEDYTLFTSNYNEGVQICLDRDNDGDLDRLITYNGKLSKSQLDKSKLEILSSSANDFNVQISLNSLMKSAKGETAYNTRKVYGLDGNFLANFETNEFSELKESTASTAQDVYNSLLEEYCSTE